jgi:energy-coupling factor transporter ATP-binding protein EcfA2
MITSIFGWLSSHPVFSKILLITISSGATIVLSYLIIFPFRSRWKDLVDKNYNDLKTKKVFALKLKKNLILFKYNRAKSETDFRNDLLWFSEKYNEDYFEIKKIEWQRYLKMDTWIKVMVPDFKEKERIDISKDIWSINLGKDSSKKIFKININEYSEIFIAGLSGSGKSVLAKNILLHCKKHEIQNYTLTSKIFDFSNYENIIDTSENLNDSIIAIKEIEEEYFKRKNILIENKKTHIKEIGMKPIFLIIDEAHHILRKTKNLDQNVMIDKIEKFIRQGRALGIITVPISQHAQKSELDINKRRCFSYRKNRLKSNKRRTFWK